MKHSFLIAWIFFAGIFVFSSCASNSTENPVVSVEEHEFEEKVSKHYKEVSIKNFSDGFNHARYKYPGSIPPWSLYDTTQILGLAENMVYMQNPDGGWAKNLDFQRVYTLSELKDIYEENKKVAPVTYGLKNRSNESTMDNRNIFSQIEYLAQVYRQVPDKRYLDCMEKALQWILNAQHPVSGGFTGADVYAITYNDDVMADALRMLRNIARVDSLYSVFPDAMRENAEKAYQKGIECILKTQITLTLKDGRRILTAWCQQHSHETLAPIWAREFEPPSVCTTESAKIAELLMEDNNPSAGIKKAIVSACEWLDMDEVRIHGKALVRKEAPGEVLNGRYYDYEQFLIDDENAPDLWARFYALDDSFDVTIGARKPIQGTYPEVNTPVWCDRGCKYCAAFNDISKERRNGYSNIAQQPAKTLQKYKTWKTKFGL